MFCNKWLLLNFIIMGLFQADAGIIIWEIFCVAWILLPLIWGTILCLKNDTLSGAMKAAWIFAFLIGGVLAFIVYLAIYSKHHSRNK